jgi:FYVE/RhoGEF/PH domain-containing protein 5/6
MPDQDLLLNFTNLPEICKLSKYLLNKFECRLKTWNYSQKISDILVNNDPNLTIYTEYMKNFSTMSRQFDECCQKYPQFGKLLTKFEKLSKCRNLKIKHFLLKPVQRLPQYKLLLGDYFGDTMEALRIVGDVLEHTNDII